MSVEQSGGVPGVTHPAPLPEHVRASLRKYPKHTTMTCLECGYSGLMGVKQTTSPWYLSTWFFLVLAVVLAPLSWPFILIYVVAKFFSSTHTTECPNCSQELVGREHVP